MTGRNALKLWRIISFVLLLPILFLAASLIGAIIPNGVPKSSDPQPHTVHLISGPIHYDFLIPLNRPTLETFATLERLDSPMQDPAAEWLLVGWGAREFYTTVGSYSDLTTRAIWRGITGDQSVMRVDVVGALPPDFPTRSLAMSDAQLRALLGAIKGSFERETPLSHQGFSASDYFYPAKGRFHIARTCNVWIAQMLRAAGQRFGIWTPLPFSVTLSHWLYARN